jgi:hypothetical protein
VSEAAAADGPSVAVDRLDARCLVADQAAESVRLQIDRIARTRLEYALARAVQQLVAADASWVWLIRELDAAVSLGLDEWSEDELAYTWAEGIVRSLAETIAAGPDGDRVIRFPSRGAFLAEFAADVVAGRAWQRWWYTSLESLRSLPAGTAVREALAASPADGVEALALLVEERRFERVVDALSERDALVLLDACFPVRRPRGTIAAESVETVLSAVATLRLAEPLATARNALRIVVTVAGEGTDRAPRWLAERLLAVVALARTVGGAECVRALRTEDMAALARGARVDTAVAVLLPELVELAAGEPALVARAARVAEPPAQAARAGSTLLTEFAGAFLLLPSLLELDLPGLDDTLRLQVLARCVGAHDPAAASDPGLLLAAGAERPWSDPARDADPALARLLLERLVRLGRVEGGCLRAELAPTPHGDALVLRDVRRDAWAYASPADDPARTLERGLRLVHEASELPCEHVSFGAGLEHLGSEAPPDTAPAELERWLAHARPPTDLNALSLPRVPPAADLTWSLVAHAIVRGLSGRLLGFDLSGVPYLQQNFLQVRATVRVVEGAIEVELARNPLQIVLQLAGSDRSTTVVPWLGGELTIRLGDN